MKEVKGDIWDYYDAGSWIVVTTNGSIRQDGASVMGRGIALQAANRFPTISRTLGAHIKFMGNRIHCFSRLRLIFFPVKHMWMEMADITLIEESCIRLKSLVSTDQLPYYDQNWYAGIEVPVYMVRPGCGNGKLSWKAVKPILEKYLDDRFIVVERES